MEVTQGKAGWVPEVSKAGWQAAFGGSAELSYVVGFQVQQQQ